MSNASHSHSHSRPSRPSPPRFEVYFTTSPTLDGQFWGVVDRLGGRELAQHFYARHGAERLAARLSRRYEARRAELLATVAECDRIGEWLEAHGEAREPWPLVPCGGTHPPIVAEAVVDDDGGPDLPPSDDAALIAAWEPPTTDEEGDMEPDAVGLGPGEWSEDDRATSGPLASPTGNLALDLAAIEAADELIGGEPGFPPPDEDEEQDADPLAHDDGPLTLKERAVLWVALAVMFGWWAFLARLALRVFG